MSLRLAQAKLAIRPYLENKIKTKGWGHNSSGRPLAYYA
jgi:hypothetical protein